MTALHRHYDRHPLLAVGWLFAGLAAVRLAGAYQEVVLVLALLVTPIALAAVPRTGWASLGLCRPRSTGGVVAGTAVTTAAYAVSVGAVVLLVGTGDGNWAANLPDFFRLGLLPGSAGGVALDVLSALVVLGIVVPLVEEVFYRGLLHATLEPRLGPWRTVAVTATAWSLVHLGDYGLNPFQPVVVLTVLPSVLLMGLALGWTRMRTGSVWACVVAQGAANLLLALWVVHW